MRRLEDALAANAAQLQAAAAELVRLHGDAALGGISAGQVLGGLRGVTAIVCETSVVSPETGLSLRGIPLLGLVDRTPEEVFWLLLTGSLPDAGTAVEFSSACARLSELPQYLHDFLEALPAGSHPMVLLSTAVLAMRAESNFSSAYSNLPARELWRPALADAILLFSRLPGLAASIYLRSQGRGGGGTAISTEASWAQRLSAGLTPYSRDAQPGFADCLRLLAVVQSDHEGANACALAANTAASALADPFLALSAGLNALAGPVHGLASEMSLRFILALLDQHGPTVSEEAVLSECAGRLGRGQVIPGFGHAVLRCPDPRFTAVHQFAGRAMPNDPVFRVCDVMARRVPELLIAGGKAKNPWPNIDFISGPVLQHYGILDPRFLTVIFGISLAIGVLAQFVVNRALDRPLLRPRSISLAGLRRLAEDRPTA